MKKALVVEPNSIWQEKFINMLERAVDEYDLTDNIGDARELFDKNNYTDVIIAGTLRDYPDSKPETLGLFLTEEFLKKEGCDFDIYLVTNKTMMLGLALHLNDIYENRDVKTYVKGRPYLKNPHKEAWQIE